MLNKRSAKGQHFVCKCVGVGAGAQVVVADGTWLARKADMRLNLKVHASIAYALREHMELLKSQRQAIVGYWYWVAIHGVDCCAARVIFHLVRHNLVPKQ